MAFHDVAELPSPKLHTAVAPAIGGILMLVKYTFLEFIESSIQVKFTGKLHGGVTTTDEHFSRTHATWAGMLGLLFFFTLRQTV